MAAMMTWGVASGNNGMRLLDDVGLVGENGFKEGTASVVEDELGVKETVGADHIISSGNTCETRDPVPSRAILDIHPT